MASVKLTNVKKIYGKDTVAVQVFQSLTISFIPNAQKRKHPHNAL